MIKTIIIIPANYLPKTLSHTDRKKHIQSIIDNKIRPKVKSFKSSKSKWVKKFTRKYNKNITDSKWINKHILSHNGQRKVLNKGKGAYFSSGSRPNQTPQSWAYARLSSVIMNGPARKIDKHIWKTYKI
jgi:hypothetical protein